MTFYPLTEELGGMTEVAFYEAKRLFLQGGAYYEFGVAGGYNLWRAILVGDSISDRIQYHGFDSFEGMPVDADYSETDASWYPGAFAFSQADVYSELKKRVGDSADRLWLHKGWFSTEHFRKLDVIFQFLPAAVVVVDCDLYESTIPVLEFIRPLLRVGTIILLDDWDCPSLGEQRAWQEFKSRHPSIRTSESDYGRFSRRVKVEAI